MDIVFFCCSFSRSVLKRTQTHTQRVYSARCRSVRLSLASSAVVYKVVHRSYRSRRASHILFVSKLHTLHTDRNQLAHHFYDSLRLYSVSDRYARRRSPITRSQLNQRNRKRGSKTTENQHNNNNNNNKQQAIQPKKWKFFISNRSFVAPHSARNGNVWVAL